MERALCVGSQTLRMFFSCRRLNLRTEREREPDPFWDEISDPPRRKQRKLLRAGRGFKESDVRSENQRRSGGWGQIEERMSDEEVQFLRRRQVQ